MSFVDLLAQRDRNRSVRTSRRRQLGLEELEGRTLPAMFMPAWSTLAPQYKFLSELAASMGMSHHSDFVQVSPGNTQASTSVGSTADASAGKNNINSLILRISADTFSVFLQVQVGIVNQPGSSGGGSDSRPGSDASNSDTHSAQATHGTATSRFDFSATDSGRSANILQAQELLRPAATNEEVPVTTTRTTANPYALIYLGGGGIRSEEDQNAEASKLRPQAIVPPTPVPTPPAQTEPAQQNDDNATPAPVQTEDAQAAIQQSLLEEKTEEETPVAPFELPVEVALADVDVLSATVAAGLLVGCNWNLNRIEEEVRRRNRFECVK